MAEAEAADSSRAAEVPSTDNKASSNGRMPEPNATPSDQDHGEEEAIVLSNGEASKPIANGNVDSADKARETESNANGSVEGGASGDDGEHEDDKSDDDPFAGLDDVASMDIYDLSNYTFGKKNEEAKSKAMRDMHPAEIARSLQRNYEQRGMRRSVGAVLLVHAHNFPHILLLQRTDGKGEYSLPGGRLLAGESDEEGLRRKLDSKLKPSEGAPAEEQEIEIGEKICNWYAIDFQRRYYPYVPAHVTKPKEELHVYTALLPNKFMFSVPKNLQLVAVPLFELYNNSSTYGDVISAVPALLSRWHINFC